MSYDVTLYRLMTIDVEKPLFFKKKKKICSRTFYTTSKNILNTILRLLK